MLIPHQQPVLPVTGDSSLFSSQVALAKLCEEAALASGLSIANCQVWSNEGLGISSEADTLHLGAGILSLAPTVQIALMSYALFFHEESKKERAAYAFPQMASTTSNFSSVGLARLWTALKSVLKTLLRPGTSVLDERVSAGEIDTKRACPEANQAIHEAALLRFNGNRLHLLQALLALKLDQDQHDWKLPGVALMADEAQANSLAALVESQLAQEPDQALPNALQLAYKTSALLDPLSPSMSAQVQGLNRLYQSAGPVGDLAKVISRLKHPAMSMADHVQTLQGLLLLSLLNDQSQLGLIDLAAHRFSSETLAFKQALVAKLRESLVSAAPGAILAWTLFSLLQVKLQKLALAPEQAGQEHALPLNDKVKRRCLAELFFVASHLANQTQSLSSRQLRDQLDALCLQLEIDRPVTGPDDFQIAAWLQALEDLDQFAPFEKIFIIDAISSWASAASYQAWLAALDLRLRPVSYRQAQYGEGQAKALQA